jgi:hypothetical protein
MAAVAGDGSWVASGVAVGTNVTTGGRSDVAVGWDVPSDPCPSAVMQALSNALKAKRININNFWFLIVSLPV